MKAAAARPLVEKMPTPRRLLEFDSAPLENRSNAGAGCWFLDRFQIPMR